MDRAAGLRLRFFFCQVLSRLDGMTSQNFFKDPASPLFGLGPVDDASPEEQAKPTAPAFRPATSAGDELNQGVNGPFMRMMRVKSEIKQRWGSAPINARFVERAARQLYLSRHSGW